MTSTVAKLLTLRAPSGAGGLLACIAVAIAWLLLASEPARAQVAPVPRDPATPPGPTAPGEPVRESPLSVLYLKDRDGNLVRAPGGMTFEELVRLYRLDQNLDQPDTPPRVTVPLLAGTGKVQGNWAELDLALTIAVRDTEWVRVPLRLAGAVLRDPPKVENAADLFVKVENDGSLAAWIKADPKQPAKLRLAANVPIAASGAERRLALAAPRATQFSLALTVPGGRVQAEASGGATLDRVQTQGQQSIISLVGLGGDVELVWRDQAVEAARSLQAIANVTVTIESPQRASFDARVRLSVGPGQLVDKFRMRLPPNVELTADVSGCSWTPVAGSKNLVEIALAKATLGPVDVRLAGRMNSTSDKNLELGGFEVLGATQTGHIAIVVEGDWSLRFQEGQHVTRVDDLPEALKLPAVRAGFRYFRGDFSLPVSVLPKRMHLAVEPTYALVIEPNAVRLEATLKCQVRGAKCYFLDLALAGWQVESVEPDTLVDSENTLLEETAPFRIPLLRGTAGEFDVKVRARRTIERGTGRLTVPLPTATASVVHPPLIVVSSSDNLRLTPVPSEMPSLALDTGPAPPVPGGGQVFVYRGSAEGAATAFVADRSLRGRTIQVAGRGTATFAPGEVTVEERLDYSIQNEPIGRLTWRIPSALTRPDSRLVVRIDDQVVSPEFDPEGTMSDEGGDRVLATIPLREPLQGTLVVTAAYRIPFVEGDQAAAVQVLPLIAPVEGEVTSRSVRFAGQEAARVVVGAGSWTRRTGSPASPEFFTEGAAEEISVELAPVSARVGAGPRVERLWLQTLVTSSGRQDRAVFRVAAPDNRVRVVLPEGVRPEEVDVIVDGVRPANVVPRPPRELHLEWTAATPGLAHALELWYPYPTERPGLAPIAPQPPEIVGAPWVPRVYWQVVTPAHEILLATPPGMLPEFEWQWRGLGWSPEGRLDQAALEDWSGATHQAAAPEGMNQYLVSGFGTRPGELRLGDRRFWFVAAAGTILSLGLLLVYVPVARHPVLVAALAVALVAIAMYDGTLALLAAQGVVAGIALAVLAFVLEMWLVRKRTEQPAPTASDSRSSQPRPDSRARELRTTESVPSISRDSSRTPALHTVAPAPAAVSVVVATEAGGSTSALAAAPLGQDGP